MAGEEVELEDEFIHPSNSICELLVAAFLAMEPMDCLISLAKECGGGSITKGVQSFIWEHCINNDAGMKSKANYFYVKKFLKRLIATVESSGLDLLDGLYEQYAYYMTSFKDDIVLNGNTRVYKSISFLLPNVHPGDQCSRPRNLVVLLQCSLNMLEGDTGCSVWPSSLFLSEYILSYPEIFSNKFCFEIGSGVGLVGMCLGHANASKVVLTDGDLPSLSNMKSNLELNQLNAENSTSLEYFCNLNSIECKFLPWESSSEELQTVKPDIVLGADIIYDPSCVPHLIRVLALLLTPHRFKPYQDYAEDKFKHDFGFNRGKIHEHATLWDNDSQYLNVCSSEDSSFQRLFSDCCSSNPQNEKASNRNDNRSGAFEGDARNSSAPDGRCQQKEGPVAYIATVIRNLDTFIYFLRLARGAHLCVTNITGRKQPLNLLPYMHSYDRSSIQLYEVYFSCSRD